MSAIANATVVLEAKSVLIVDDNAPGIWMLLARDRWRPLGSL